MKGDVIYQKAFENLIDYCGFIARGSYADKYSPNNIKRLIISPDCIEAHYHIALPNGGGRVKRVPISSQMLSVISQQEDYVPVLRILGTDRICASVEEIIMLVNSNDGNVYLTSTELDFASLIKSYASKGSSIEESIKRRYKRLRAFVIVYTNYSEFTKNMHLAGNHGKDFLYELPFLSGANVKLFNEDDDWYKKWGSAGQTYEADKVGGCVYEYFANFAKQKEAQLKKDAVDRHKSETNKDAIKKFEDLFKRYKGMYQAYKQVAEVTNTGVLVQTNVSMLPWASLMKCSGLPDKYPRIEEAPSEGKALSENTDRIKKAMIELQNQLTSAFGANLDKTVSEFPMFVYVNKHDSQLRMPSALLRNKEMAENLNFLEGSERPRDCFINVCYMFVKIFGDRDFSKWNDEMATRQYWEAKV